MSDPLRLQQIMKYTHLGAVISPGKNFGDAVSAQLAIRRVTVEYRVQLRPNACCVFRYGRLAAVASGRARLKGDKGKPNAALLSALRLNGRRPGVAGSETRQQDAV